jgi:cobalt-zinc-cadmium efflux system membrane fusion protein
MTDAQTPSRETALTMPSPQGLPAKPPPAPRWARVKFGLTLAAIFGVLVYLLWPSGRSAGLSAAPGSSSQDPVQLTESGLIRIHTDSPLHKKLQVASVQPKRIAAPVLTVTGNVVASLRPAKGGAKDWQFNSPELLTAFTDWQKAVADISFSKTQLDSTRQLSESRVAAQGAIVRRLKKLVEAGTDTERDLAAAQTELLQAEIQGRKEVHEAETAWRLAQRSEAALSRQLQQAGIDPDLLRATGAEVDIVVADVPEAFSTRVRLGQGCGARFLSLGGTVFSGTVRSISPVLSKERRSLRVLFTIADPDDLLRPGMFADIGLGTDAREALLVPVAGVVHVGRSDYLLVRADKGDWRATAVQVGELRDSAVEILGGLKTGDQVVGQGAILLKPVISEAVQRFSSPAEGGP